MKHLSYHLRTTFTICCLAIGLTSCARNPIGSNGKKDATEETLANEGEHCDDNNKCADRFKCMDNICRIPCLKRKDCPDNNYCGEHGYCTSGNPICNPGWTGDDCDQCAEHWEGDQCDHCQDGWYGDNCDKKVSCLNGTMDPDNGTCSDCNSDYSGENCDIAKTCVNGTVNSGISGNGKCKDGSCRNNWAGENCDQCDSSKWVGSDCDVAVTCVNGTVDNSTGKCSACDGDWSGTDCDISKTCVNGTANTGLNGNGKCQADSCANHWSGEDCDTCDSSLYLGANCDVVITCAHGTLNTSTGKCSACDGDWSGENCTIPMTCENGIANTGLTGDGACTVCNGNYAMPNCSDCAPGWYGAECDIERSCDNGEVNPEDGTCLPDTCLDGWIGENCDQCDDETYGWLCDEEYMMCRHGVPDFDDETGSFSFGYIISCRPSTCNGNWTNYNDAYWDGDVWNGELCDLCPEGYYGDHCEHVVEKCLHGTLDSATGKCVADSCDEHWTGEYCDTCAAGWFGQNCEEASVCQHGVLDHIFAECLYCDEHWINSDDAYDCSKCEEGWFGDDCNTKATCILGATDPVTGHCLNGSCESGYWGEDCDKEGATCVHGKTDNLTGKCISGSCVTVWTGENCDECAEYFSGDGCKTFDKEGASGSIIDPRDGSSYNTIQIGGQTWLSENLHYDGGSLEYLSVDNNTDYDAKFGYLYTWDQAQEVCPEGWHLPSLEEYSALIQLLSEVNTGDSYFSDLVAEDNSWENYNNLDITDNFKYTALPAGFCYKSDKIYCQYFGWSAYFWSSTEGTGSDTHGYFFSLRDLSYPGHYYGKQDLGQQWKYYAFSVRCLKNAE